MALLASLACFARLHAWGVDPCLEIGDHLVLPLECAPAPWFQVWANHLSELPALPILDGGVVSNVVAGAGFALSLPSPKAPA